MASPTDENGANRVQDVASHCLDAIRGIEGELSGESQAVLVELETFLTKVVGKEGEDGTSKNLDDTEEAYLLNYTDSITLSDMPVKRGSFLMVDEPSPLGQNRSRATSMSSESMDNLPLELAMIDSWEEFDVFSLDKTSKGRTLEMVCMVLLEELQLMDSLKLDRTKMRKFLQTIESLYLSNPYHNHVHAADVVQALGVFLCKDDLKSSLVLKFTDLELLSMILAAATHDVGHQGLTNEFHVNSNSDLAIMYNDRSVNENMHASQAFRSMSDSCCNVLGELGREDYIFVRRTMINIILATDMAYHNKLLSQFALHAKMGDSDAWSSAEARSILHQMLVHSADISNPARPWVRSSVWSHRVLEELFLQGDRERKLNMPTSPLCNRGQVELPKSQSTFLNYIVKPSFELLQIVAPKSAELALKHIDINIKEWESLGAESNSGPGTPPGNNCLVGMNGN